MTTLRNIAKRKELAEIIYKKYNATTKEEQNELTGKVGATFDGYQSAMRDIIQIIVDCHENDDTLKNIKDFITEQLNGQTKRCPFRFSEVPDTDMCGYINSTVKNELIQHGKTEDEAKQICNAFIEYPYLRQGIIDNNDLNTIRVCERCGKPMYEGYLVEDVRTYCSDECVLAKESWIDDVNDLRGQLTFIDDEDSIIIWTKWEG